MMVRKKRKGYLPQHSYPLISKEQIAEIVTGRISDGRFIVSFDRESSKIELISHEQRLNRYRSRNRTVQCFASINKKSLPKDHTKLDLKFLQLRATVVDLGGSGDVLPTTKKDKPKKSKRIDKATLTKMISEGKIKIIYNGNKVKLK